MPAKPVIGSRIGSTECVIRDGVDGIARDTTTIRIDLAKAVIQLLSDRETRERMGSAGHDKTLASFTWERIADKVEHIYKERVRADGKPRDDSSGQWHEYRGHPRESASSSRLTIPPVHRYLAGVSPGTDLPRLRSDCG